MYRFLARQFRPCTVRRAISPKGAKILLLSRTLSDKSAGGGHDACGHSESSVAKACTPPAVPPPVTQRLATEPNHGHPKAKQEQLLELMKLTEELQQKVMKLNRDVQAGKETMPIHLRKILIGLRKAHEGVDTAFELDENQKICRAFQAAGICFNVRDDIRYLVMKEFRERNTFIHIDTCGNIREFDDRTTLFPVVKELTIQPNSDKEVVTLYLSHHFIFLLEEIEDSTAETNTCTEKEFRIATRFLYSCVSIAKSLSL